ncbi:hypothetical protein ATN89_17350 [Comamonas thiooxydans]|uniref:hypothetical protein n=1 Tax=Comamonas thiooxydans TaxID=363952 RepID=UPI0007C5AB10|nr:hypothetical protein [Comamonas thiooxydans]OAD82850.1 hypothetical protein ATN89_17350 [Comamonas thiooxydans]
MNKYDVTVIYDASNSGAYKANSPQEAAELAECDQAGRQCLCHQCAHEVEMGDVIGAHVYLNDELVLDTTYNGERIKELEEEVLRLKREVNSFTGTEPAYPEVQ